VTELRRFPQPYSFTHLLPLRSLTPLPLLPNNRTGQAIRHHGAAETSLTAADDLAIRRAFEAVGVEFIDENGGGPGVRLRNRQQRNS
jgi:hypothetical protein